MLSQNNTMNRITFRNATLRLYSSENEATFGAGTAVPFQGGWLGVQPNGLHDMDGVISDEILTQGDVDADRERQRAEALESLLARCYPLLVDGVIASEPDVLVCDHARILLHELQSNVPLSVVAASPLPPQRMRILLAEMNPETGELVENGESLEGDISSNLEAFVLDLARSGGTPPQSNSPRVWVERIHGKWQVLVHADHGDPLVKVVLPDAEDPVVLIQTDCAHREENL